MTTSIYFVYELMNEKYEFIGTIKVNDGEKAKEKAIKAFYPDVPALWRPHVRVSTQPLGEHAKSFLPRFLPKQP